VTHPELEHHRHGRGRVIGVVLAGCVLAGGIGALAGEVFDPEPVRGGQVVQPGEEPAVGGPGQSVAFGWPSADDSGSSPDSTGGSGSVVTLPGDVPVFVPTGWEVTGRGDNSANLADGEGSFAFALTGRANPGSSATGLLAANLPVLLPPESYTQQLLVDYGEIAPFGTIVSAAYAEYDAMVADNQGAVPMHGQIYVGLRQDDVALLLLVEHTPSQEWDSVGFPAIKELVNTSYGLFGGLG
jgi:hypothetical protein